MRNDGGAVSVGGSSGIAAEMAVCTSVTALSMLRFRSNVSVMLVLPVPLCEVISSMPAIVVNWRSSGLATDAAIVTGSPPGRFALHVDRRILDGRQIADRQRAVRDDAEERDRRHQQAGGDRAPDEDFGDVHDGVPLRLASAASDPDPAARPPWPLTPPAPAATAAAVPPP